MATLAAQGWWCGLQGGHTCCPHPVSCRDVNLPVVARYVDYLVKEQGIRSVFGERPWGLPHVLGTGTSAWFISPGITTMASQLERSVHQAPGLHDAWLNASASLCKRTGSPQRPYTQ